MTLEFEDKLELASELVATELDAKDETLVTAEELPLLMLELSEPELLEHPNNSKLLHMAKMSLNLNVELK